VIPVVIAVVAGSVVVGSVVVGRLCVGIVVGIDVLGTVAVVGPAVDV
jgi:hypothetical protein